MDCDSVGKQEVCSLEAKGPQAEDQFNQEQAREYETSMLQSLPDVWYPFIILDALVTVDQGDQDVGKQASNVECNESQDEVMLLLGDEQSLASLLISMIAADHRAFLVARIVLAPYEGLLLTAVLIHSGKCCASGKGGEAESC